MTSCWRGIGSSTQSDGVPGARISCGVGDLGSISSRRWIVNGLSELVVLLIALVSPVCGEPANCNNADLSHVRVQCSASNPKRTTVEQIPPREKPFRIEGLHFLGHRFSWHL